MTFSCGASGALPAADAPLTCRRPASVAVEAPAGLPDDADAGSEPFRWRTLGAGKLCFLSTASTVRWNLRKRPSARVMVDGRSIVFDSSLTR